MPFNHPYPEDTYQQPCRKTRMEMLAAKIKGYEAATEILLPKSQWIFARIDGRAFHTFTKGLKRPFDERLHACMVETTVALCEETGAKIGYTQSDEITLMWSAVPKDSPSQLWFGGRHSKMVSQTAAIATSVFQKACYEKLPLQYMNKSPTFDSRVFCAPTEDEAVDVFAWRQEDCWKNSVSMAAQSVWSSHELHGKGTKIKLEMLKKHGIDFAAYPQGFTRGTFIAKTTIKEKIPAEELANLPPKHNARLNPDLEFERSYWSAVERAPFSIIDVDGQLKLVFERA